MNEVKYINACLEEADESYEEYLTNSSEYDTDSSSSDESEAGRPVLAFDPSQLSGGDIGLPQNGHDYLKLVQEERKNYPQVVSCTVFPPPVKTTTAPMEISESASSSSSSTREEETKSSNNAHDDLKYHKEIINNFINLKEEIEAIRQSCDREQLQQQHLHDEKLETSGGKQSTKVKYDDKNINRLLRLMELGHSPQLSDIIDKDQFEIHQTLEKLADECVVVHSNYRLIHTDWIYSLMAALRDPIEADIYSTLRRLAKICISHRKSYEQQSRGGGKEGEGDDEEEEDVGAREMLSSCLLIICIVRHHFGQMDLE